MLVQRIIQERLRQLEPSIAFVGEEGEAAAGSTARRYWLVDPICGTVNFAAGIPLFATNIALVEDDEVTCSAVADGATGEVYIAERGHGAFRLSSGGAPEPLRASADSRLVSVDPHGVGFAGFGPLFAQRALQPDQGWDVRILATTLALVYLASGRLAGTVYTHLGSPVHFAAGLLLAHEAGAIVTDEAGGAWTLDRAIYVIGADAEMHALLRTLAASVVASLR